LRWDGGSCRSWNPDLTAHIAKVNTANLPNCANRQLGTAPDLFGRDRAPAGLRYAADLISASEEQSLVRHFASLPFKPFEFHGYLGNRRVVSYGHRYDYAARALRGAGPMPAFLEPLKQVAGEFTGIPAAAFEQALVTEYPPGAGIGWHRDKPMFENVVGLSFLVPCTLRLRRKAATGWERHAVRIEPRSAYLLHGAVRDEWEHSITPLDVLRYSVTFRTFRPARDGER
jgi:alkylated DNA repair dioxygenase AlkB